MTVRQNLGYGLKCGRRPGQISKRVERVARLLRLEELRSAAAALSVVSVSESR
jgi:ABC-type sugar transport system ATPase subunit